MSKNNNRSSGKKARNKNTKEILDTQESWVETRDISNSKKFPKLEPKSYVQQDYMDAIQNNDIVFAVGSAGVGKSYIATHYAAEQLYYKKVEKIILTRPAVAACGEDLGFLPGELVAGKLMPYLTPYMETLNKLLGKSFVEYCLKVGSIEPVPMGFLRGRTFSNCIVLGDEFENATPMQLKLILTRMGESCKMLINGDIAQRDVRENVGLEDAIGTLRHLDRVDVVQFREEDCVRSGITKDILKAYRDR